MPADRSGAAESAFDHVANTYLSLRSDLATNLISDISATTVQR